MGEKVFNIRELSIVSMQNQVMLKVILNNQAEILEALTGKSKDLILDSFDDALRKEVFDIDLDWSIANNRMRSSSLDEGDNLT